MASIRPGCKQYLYSANIYIYTQNIKKNLKSLRQVYYIYEIHWKVAEVVS